MASPVLPTLVILCVKEPSPVQKGAMEKWKHNNDYGAFQFYWMNRFVFVLCCLPVWPLCWVSSSLHDQVVRHLLQGQVHPAIIVVNYSKVCDGDICNYSTVYKLFVIQSNVSVLQRSVFNKELREPFSVEDIGDFLVDVASGKQEPNC